MKLKKVTVPVKKYSLWTEFDIYLFKQGKHFELYKLFGSHKVISKNESGYYFAVFAPGAKSVSVIGDYNNWDGTNYQLNVRWDESGIWEGFIPGFPDQSIYKYNIKSDHIQQAIEKSDPYAKHCETPPKTGSITWPLEYQWKDKEWLKNRKKVQNFDTPFSIYEVHLGSWKRKGDDQMLTYRALADELVPYVEEMGFTHVEFMPVMEHPYDMSWGYQITGYFAPTSRFGTPQDFKFLIDSFHKAGIGVLLDWVPSHFPADAHGLAKFDGSCVYEHPDLKKGYHPDWESLIFNYDRPEIRSFLISNATFWADEYHIDGFRVDAVASMIYLDYSRESGEWDPNEFGGNHNLSALKFLKDLNAHLYKSFPDIHMIAEESTSFDGVTKPVHEGGLGFGLKWMMGWMNDTLSYFSKDPIYRKHHQGQITFSMIYAFSENFVLPFSHDEVVHGKKSLIYKMPGDEWQKFANLRLLYSYMYAHPGAKLLFMGSEFAQTSEWNCREGLPWHLLTYAPHIGISRLIKKLNNLLRLEPSLYENNYNPEGFEWVDISDENNSIVAFERIGKNPLEKLLVVINFTPQSHSEYRIKLSSEETMQLIFNSDRQEFGGSGYEIKQLLTTVPDEENPNIHHLNLALPPLSLIMMKKEKSMIAKQ